MKLMLEIFIFEAIMLYIQIVLNYTIDKIDIIVRKYIGKKYKMALI